MPQAVVHVLFTIIVLDLFRDYVLKDKKKIPLWFIFIGGIAGLLPDIDIPLFWLFKYIFGLEVPWFHRTLSHSLIFPAVFLAGALIFSALKNKKGFMLMIIFTFGTSFHILLDYLFTGQIMPFYPLSAATYGLELISGFGIPALAEGIEAIVLLLWLYDVERRHKLSDFI